MKRVLVETNIYSSGLAGKAGAAAILRQAEELLICPIVAGELFAGLKKGARHSRNMAIFNKFLQSPRVSVITCSL